MILKARNIEKSYGSKLILDEVSLFLEAGKIYGVVGENGSGKTTLLKSLIGLTRIDRGQIDRMGSLGYCPQIPSFFEQLTIEEHFKYFCAAYGMDFNTSSDHIHFLLHHLRFKSYYKTRVSELSGGTKQKLNLAIALMHRPQILILDEPYNGFDWETYLRFWELTDSLKKENTTVLIVTHFINELNRFDHVFNLKDHKLYEME